MSEKSWTVTVDGKRQSITVDVDAQSGRAVIRVNGRTAAKPMSADESEREIPVGSMRYVVRRGENGKFDLDVPPEVFLDRVTAEKAQPERPKRGGAILWIIGAIVVLVIAGGMLRFGRRGLEYMKVSWQQYNASDGSFTANFPGVPAESQEDKNINGDIWKIKSFLSEYKSHAYAVQYIDMKTIVTDDNADYVMNSFFSGWVQALGGSVEMREKTSIARNHAFNFIVSVPPQEELNVRARLRGFFVMRGNRLFIVWAAAAQEDPFSSDLHEFLDAFRISPPSERTAQLSPQVKEALSGDGSVALAPPPPTPQSEAAQRAEELAEKQREEQIAARRAAEPQIYLEPEWKMYHVAGCKAVTPQMQRVAVEQKPFGYVPHNCVPDDVRNWKWGSTPAKR